ncbi:MAG: peptidoglycan-binding protein, partial [Proteobacteria bacterium]|nr:peptidoglycan-binding protein [Pseudomonadota bacterium]
IIEKPADSAILPDNKDNPAAATMVQPPTPETIVTASVASFLSAYGLESYSLQFQQALNQKNLHDIRDTIFDQTGLHLIKLDTVTPPVRGNFDILSSIDPAGQKTEFYLFWKPWLKIVKFYAGYRGEEIRELQKLLSKVHLYDYNIDGIVGQIIMKSVKEFQRQNNLQVTGFPGPETIFMLANRDPR